MNKNLKVQSFLKVIRYAFPFFVLTASLLVMWSWQSAQNVLIIQIRANYAPMQFNTALLFACLSLVVLSEKHWRRTTDLFAFFVVISALATLSQYFTQTDLGIDQFFITPSITTLTSHPGRMAPQTAFVFILLGLSQLLRRFNNSVLLSDMACLLAAGISLLGLSEYVSKASIAFAWGNFSKMAVLTCVAFILLSIAAMVANFLNHQDRWKLAPYLGSALVLSTGLTLWVAYFDKIAEATKAELGASLLRDGEMIKTLIDDRLKSMNRMADRISRTGPNYEWEKDLKNYFQDYHDLRKVFVTRKGIEKNASTLSTTELYRAWEIERTNLFVSTLNKMPLYFHRSIDFMSVAFEMDFSEIASRVLVNEEYFSSIRLGDLSFHVPQTTPALLNAEWGQEMAFQLPTTTFVLRKTPSSQKLAANQAVLSLALLAIIFVGTVLAAYGIRLNVDLRESKNVVSNANAKLKALIEALPFGVFQTDALGECFFVSKKWCDLTGLSASEAYGNGWTKALHPDDRDTVYREWNVASKSKKEFELKYRFLKENGKVVWVHGKAVMLWNEAGIATGSIGGVLDISGEVEKASLVEAQQVQLIQNDRMQALGQMAGGIAHEINNPLTAIEMTVNLIREMAENNLLANEFAVSASTKISSLVHRISATIRGLRAFARDGSQDPFEPFQLSALIDETLLLCKDRFEREGVSLELKNSSKDLLITCRPAQVSQVLLNLLGNSLDAVTGSDNPWVRIEVSADISWIYIHVIDSGSGIPVDLQTKIMDPFFTTKEIGKGTGLGLSISMGIMKSHGGLLEYNPNNLNTMFVIKFPKQTKDKKVENEKNA